MGSLSNGGVIAILNFVNTLDSAFWSNEDPDFTVVKDCDDNSEVCKCANATIADYISICNPQTIGNLLRELLYLRGKESESENSGKKSEFKDTLCSNLTELCHSDICPLSLLNSRVRSHKESLITCPFNADSVFKCREVTIDEWHSVI